MLDAKGNKPKSYAPQNRNNNITLESKYGNTIVGLGGGDDIFKDGMWRDQLLQIEMAAIAC